MSNPHSTDSLYGLPYFHVGKRLDTEVTIGPYLHEARNGNFRTVNNGKEKNAEEPSLYILNLSVEKGMIAQK